MGSFDASFDASYEASPGASYDASPGAWVGWPTSEILLCLPAFLFSSGASCETLKKNNINPSVTNCNANDK